MEYRQISAAERTATMFPLQAYAFMPSPSTDADEAAYRARMAFYETAVSLIAEEDGRTLAGVGGLRMRQNVRGLVHDMAGVASVSSHPSARRRGLVRELLNRLLRQMRDEGCAVSALYPFRPSFYARFGYVGVPRARRVTFAPEGLAHLVRAELPGGVERLSNRDGFAAYDGLTKRLLVERHGFAVFDEVRTAGFAEDRFWIAVARVDGEVVGAVRYRIEDWGGDLVASDLLTTGPLGRALLLQFFARHADQVGRIVVSTSADELPELWGEDFPVVSTAEVSYPSRPGPMVRVLDMGRLDGTPMSGDGEATIEIVDDEWIGGTWHLRVENQQLSVTKGTKAGTTLTAAGFSALFYGVLDPMEVFTRGLGEYGPALAPLFPRRTPYVFADF